LEKPPRSGHSEANSLGFVASSPLKLKDPRSFQEMAEEGDNSEKIARVFPLNLKYPRNSEKWSVLATILWSLSR